MRRPAQRFIRAAANLLAVVGLLSCSDLPTAPQMQMGAPLGPQGDVTATVPALVISQIYGGGGNAGATYKNDFIEIFNPGSAPVSVAGWSVQYASATGTSWAATPLTGTIPAGGYYLVQEAVGAGGTTALPTPDATGTIAMSATAGKVLLASQTGAFSGACPTGATLIDVVGFGPTANCRTPTAALTNTTAAARNNGGCAWTPDAPTDFTLGAPAPRNSATPVHSCGVVAAPVAIVTVTPDSTGVLVGATVNFTASASDGGGNPTTTTFTWASGNTAVATVDANGVATGVAAGLVTITATAANGVADTVKLNVTAPTVPITNHAGDIVISQIYGGGGNAGASYKNDFVELFNRTSQPIDVTGWSVQYASATATFTQATPLSGTIPAGGYYLVQEAAGAAGTVDLPAADVVGTIPMGAAAGKILLIQSATPSGASCPTGIVVVDEVSYGTGTNCGPTTAPLSATIDAQRRSNGCFYTPDASADFITAAPAPRNSATAPHSCVVGPLDHVIIGGSNAVLAGGTSQLTATPLDASDNNVVGATITWASSDPSVATVNASGLVTGVAANADPVTITVTAVAGAVTKTATIAVTVNNPGGINWLDVSSSSTSFPPGFQTQVFITARTAQNGTIIPANFTFEAVDPQYATVENKNNTIIVTGVAAPTDGTKPGIRITATPVAGGTPFVFVTRPITIEAPVSAPTSVYAVNDEFGDPTPANPTDPNDFLIRRAQYTISYNQSRGTPNWVSYELDARQMVVGQDRCNCFTADPLLPAAAQIFTSDYTNGGFDRGHMTRSADRTLANVDNASTFMLTNVVPQQADLNQGVWAQFENALADSARAGRAVYIITGPLFSRSHALTFVKNEGKIAIPDSTWKVALIGPQTGGNPFTRANVQSFDDLSGLTLLAVNMPNVAGVRNDPWAKYLTTVDKIEAATGLDFLSLLQTGFQPALDYKDHAPAAHFTSSGGATEGSPITFDASTSTDPDSTRTDLGRAEALTYSWHFSDNSDATGKVVTHTFSGHGAFTATLTVADAFGWPNSSTATVSLTNVPPTASLAAPSSGLEGTPFTLSLTGATDPSPSDAAALTFAFDCGAGYATASATATSSCTAADQGDVTVHAKVIDPAGAFTEYSAVVHVANVAPTATFNTPGSVARGSAIALSLTGVVDPSSADAAAGFTYSFDCGDGAGFGTAGVASTASCSTTSSGSRTVRGRVVDKDGGANEYSALVTITSVPPTAVLVAPANGVAGTAFTLSLTGATAATPADLAALRYAFDCGSGYGAIGTASSTSCTASAAGDITVRGKVIDLENVATEYTAVVHVAAPAIVAALVRHAPTLNARVDGSVQMLLGESVTFNGGGAVTGQLLVPGLPTVRINGRPSFGGTADGTGSTSPSNYFITLNGGATLGALVRRTDAVALPTVAAPDAPTGTRNVFLNSASDPVGPWATVRNLTLNGNAITSAIPEGAYGDITANGNNKIVLGVAGATTPSVYSFQHLTLNGTSSLQVVGPVIVTVGSGVSLNGSIGAAGRPEWLTLKLAQGGLTLNGNVSASAYVLVPNGTVTVNGGSSLTGALAADGLVMNGNALLKITSVAPLH
jgi:DNA/RNA endonuclease G (NUC1)